MTQNPEPGIRRILFSVATLAAIFLFSLAGSKPPKPASRSSPDGQFSADRAREVLKRVMKDEAPHPVGTSANEAVRKRIVDDLGSLGYTVSIQTAFSCSDYGSCATVNNVLARLKGLDTPSLSPTEDSRDGTPAVLLAAHYDSVPAGSGAADDGASIAAVLETARALKSLPTPRHSIIFLIDDGEEAGLLGARAFVEKHPWSKNVRAVVNLEARGTSGPSMMFETGSANAWAARLYAKRASHPTTSSIFYTVYKRLPNDTDLTVFKTAGYQGLNFAFIGDEPRYHTSLDNLANLSAASLQHQGENALSSISALANADLSAVPNAEAVYFDIFQTGIICFPAAWAAPLALVTILLLALQITSLLRTNRLAIRELLWALLLWLAIITAAAILAFLLRGGMRFGGAVLVDWVAHPLPVELAFWSLAIAVVFTLGILFGRSAGFWGLWAGTWTWWALLSFIAAWFASGLSYIFLIPAAVASIAALPATFRRTVHKDETLIGVAAILPAAIAGVVAFAPLMMLYDGLGNTALPLIAALVAVAITPMLPLCADLLDTPGLRGALFSWVPLGIALTASFVAVLVPQFSEKSPERMNIQYWKDADTNVAQWIVNPDSGHLPEPIRVVADFKHEEKGPFPWDRGPAYLTPAPRLTFSEPSFTILESSPDRTERHYRALLRSERGAPEALVLFPPHSGVTKVSIQGEPINRAIEKLRFSFGDWNIYRCLTMPPEGVEMAFALPVGKPLQVFVVDVNYGLPEEGKFLLTARPLTATPSHDGDVTIVSRSVQILP
jgi:Peptidase family M28